MSWTQMTATQKSFETTPAPATEWLKDPSDDDPAEPANPRTTEDNNGRQSLRCFDHEVWHGTL